ncbi:MAG: ATP-binding cassette domain-containing protein [Segetibacter sp.]|nr:ATP-binding cassette domain-containing protein [Segetibacter sp.]
MISLQKVSKFYNNTKAADDISFEVKEGETLVLLGTSGCGKTTTLRMINRLTEPTKGNILLNGKNILNQSPEELRRGIGYVLQHHGLFPHYTVAENIAVVPRLMKWDTARTKKRIDELLEKLQLPAANYRSLYPDQLSGGQQQRVGLARALAAEPPILLMDEPFGALDTVTRTSIRKEFREFDELRKKTIVMVTHDVQEAFELGDRICLMDKGQIVQIGTPAELLFSPANDFVRLFLQQQRLQLELQSVKVQDIWDMLMPVELKVRTEKEIPSQSSLWAAIELLSGDKNASDYIYITRKNNQQKQLDISSLMAAFAHHKTTLANG